MFDQQPFDIRCEWGPAGVMHLAPISAAIIIVDVLSFSTCIDIAAGNGAIVYPYRWKDARARDYAHRIGAKLAASRTSGTGYSLSPASLITIPAGIRLVLPSPNGATLSLLTGDTPTFAGCLRNAHAVARAAQVQGETISVIPAGERWKTDQSLRPALEDLIGAGAIIHALPGRKSPEAVAAEITFLHFQDDLLSCLTQISSGQELIRQGFAQDVELAALLNSSENAPRLVNGAYRVAESP